MNAKIGPSAAHTGVGESEQLPVPDENPDG